MSRDNTHSPKLIAGGSSQSLSVSPIEAPFKFGQTSSSGMRHPAPMSSESPKIALSHARSHSPAPFAAAPLSYLGVSRAAHSYRPHARDVQHRGLDSALKVMNVPFTDDKAIVEGMQNFNFAAGGPKRPSQDPFSAFSNIPDLIAIVDRTLDPLQSDNEDRDALNVGNLESHNLCPNIGPIYSSQSVEYRDTEPFRPRGLSVANITLLNEVWEKNGGGKERRLASSIMTLDSRGRNRREIKFDELETGSVYHGEDDAADDSACDDEEDDASIELRGGIYDCSRNRTTDSGPGSSCGDKASIFEGRRACSQAKIGDYLPAGPGLWPGVNSHHEMISMHDVDASSTQRAAIGLAKELRKLSLAPEDLVIPSNSRPTIDTAVATDLGPDMVAGLPVWEFKRAGLMRYVKSPAEAEQQEALFEAYEQGLSPKALSQEGRSDSEKESKPGGHLFVFERVLPRVGASAVASSSGEGRSMVSSPAVALTENAMNDEEDLEDAEEEEELTVLEQQQLEMALARSLDDIRHLPAGKGKGRAD